MTYFFWLFSRVHSLPMSTSWAVSIWDLLVSTVLLFLSAFFVMWRMLLDNARRLVGYLGICCSFSHLSSTFFNTSVLQFFIYLMTRGSRLKSMGTWTQTLASLNLIQLVGWFRVGLLEIFYRIPILGTWPSSIRHVYIMSFWSLLRSKELGIKIKLFFKLKLFLLQLLLSWTTLSTHPWY